MQIYAAQRDYNEQMESSPDILQREVKVGEEEGEKIRKNKNICSNDTQEDEDNNSDDEEDEEEDDQELMPLSLLSLSYKSNEKRGDKLESNDDDDSLSISSLAPSLQSFGGGLQFSGGRGNSSSSSSSSSSTDDLHVNLTDIAPRKSSDPIETFLEKGSIVEESKGKHLLNRARQYERSTDMNTLVDSGHETAIIAHGEAHDNRSAIDDDAYADVCGGDDMGNAIGALQRSLKNAHMLAAAGRRQMTPPSDSTAVEFLCAAEEDNDEDGIMAEGHSGSWSSKNQGACAVTKWSRRALD